MNGQFRTLNANSCPFTKGIRTDHSVGSLRGSASQCGLRRGEKLNMLVVEPSSPGQTTVPNLLFNECSEENSEKYGTITSFHAEIRTRIFMPRDALDRRS